MKARLCVASSSFTLSYPVSTVFPYMHVSRLGIDEQASSRRQAGLAVSLLSRIPLISFTSSVSLISLISLILLILLALIRDEEEEGLGP
jgi:hypothetical protein